MRQAMIYLQKFGISTTLAAKIYQHYGRNVYRTIEENPYHLADHVPGVGFKTADEIAMKIGIQILISGSAAESFIPYNRV